MSARRVSTSAFLLGGQSKDAFGVSSTLPVVIIIFQLIGQTPLLVILQVHHEIEHLRNCAGQKRFSNKTPRNGQARSPVPPSSKSHIPKEISSVCSHVKPLRYVSKINAKHRAKQAVYHGRRWRSYAARGCGLASVLAGAWQCC